MAKGLNLKQAVILTVKYKDPIYEITYNDI